MLPDWGAGRGALVRLVRGLAFTCVALQNMQAQPARDLYGCFKASYDSVLKHHHSFVIRSVVTLYLEHAQFIDIRGQNLEEAREVVGSYPFNSSRFGIGMLTPRWRRERADTGRERPACTSKSRSIRREPGSDFQDAGMRSEGRGGVEKFSECARNFCIYMERGGFATASNSRLPLGNTTSLPWKPSLGLLICVAVLAGPAFRPGQKIYWDIKYVEAASPPLHPFERLEEHHLILGTRYPLTTAACFKSLEIEHGPMLLGFMDQFGRLGDELPRRCDTTSNDPVTVAFEHQQLLRTRQAFSTHLGSSEFQRGPAHTPSLRLIVSDDANLDLTAFGFMASFGPIDDELDLYLNFHWIAVSSGASAAALASLSLSPPWTLALMGHSHERHHLGAYGSRVTALSTAKNTAGLTTPLIITRTYPHKPSIRLILGADADLDLFQLGFMDAFGRLRDEFVLDSHSSGVFSGASAAALALEASRCWDNNAIPRHTSLRPLDAMDVALLLVHDE
ncbi:hypothetical protein BDZ89DRAFT_1152414 [Hymenopellis radicata]|nr:hypothetical protein BDZ89DRAFT_1152414 [Hymenopellis radicata]